MSITPRLTRGLHKWLGDDAAEDLVNWMQEMDAQRADVARFDARLHEVQTDLVAWREATRADIAELRQELHAGLARLETLLERRTGDLMKWSFVFWVGAVAAVAMLAGVLP